MSDKKIFQGNGSSKKGIFEVFNKKGFYLALILAIAVIGTTAAFVTTYNIKSSSSEFDAEKLIPEEVTENVEANISDSIALNEPLKEQQNEKQQQITENKQSDAEKIKTPEVKENPKVNSTEKSIKDDLKSKSKKNEEANKTVSNSSKEQAKNISFAMPVMGEVAFEYSKDKLVYSKTLNEWRIHTGLDLSAELGTTVRAASEGYVCDIKNDPRLGVTVVLQHPNNLKTVYSNLASSEMVSINQKIKQGDVIGAIGRTALFEAAEQTHLHFEVLKNNEPVNPTEYLPQKKEN